MFNINQFFFKNIYPKTSVETNKHTVFNDDRKWNQVWNQQSRAVPPSLSSSVIIIVIVIVFVIVIVIAAVIVVNTKIYEQSFLESDISHNKTKANIYNRKLQCCEVICLHHLRKENPTKNMTTPRVTNTNDQAAPRAPLKSTRILEEADSTFDIAWR